MGATCTPSRVVSSAGFLELHAASVPMFSSSASSRTREVTHRVILFELMPEDNQVIVTIVTMITCSARRQRETFVLRPFFMGAKNPYEHETKIPRSVEFQE